MAGSRRHRRRSPSSSPLRRRLRKRQRGHRTATPTTRPTAVGRPRRRAHLVGHLRPHQRGARPTKALIDKFNEEYPDITIKLRVGPVRPGAEQVQDRRRGRLGRARTSCAPRSPGPRSSRPLGYLYALDGTAAAGGQQLPRDPALDQRVRRQDVRRPAGHRHPRPDVQQGALREGRHRPRPRPPWDEVTEAAKAAEEQGQGRRHLPQHRRLLPAALHLRRGRRPRSTSTARPSPSTAPRRSRASRPPRTWSSRRQPVKPDGQRLLRHDDDPLQGVARSGMIINGPWEVANIKDRSPRSAASTTSASLRCRRARQARVLLWAATTTASTPAWTTPRPRRPSPRGGGDRRHPESEAFIRQLAAGLLPGNADSYDLASPTTRRWRLWKPGARRGPRPSVDPRGWPVLRPARRDGHQGARAGRRPPRPRWTTPRRRSRPTWCPTTRSSDTPLGVGAGHGPTPPTTSRTTDARSRSR